MLPFLHLIACANHPLVGDRVSILNQTSQYTDPVDDLVVDYGEMDSICFDSRICPDVATEETVNLLAYIKSDTPLSLFGNASDYYSYMIPEGERLAYTFLGEDEASGMGLVFYTSADTLLRIQRNESAKSDEFDVVAGLITDMYLKRGDEEKFCANISVELSSTEDAAAFDELYGVSSSADDVYLGGYLDVSDLMQDSCFDQVIDAAESHGAIDMDQTSHFGISVRIWGLSQYFFEHS